MPFINTNTNVEISSEKREILKSRLGNAISIMGKSENWLMLSFEDNCNMYFQGDDEADLSYFKFYF